MAMETHKGQILPLKNQLIPISEHTVLHGSFDQDLNLFHQGKRVPPVGYEKALYFNGTDTYIQTRWEPYTHITGNTFTLEAWAYPTTLSGQRTVLGNYEAGGIGLEINGNRWRGLFYLDGSYKYAISTAAPVLNKWVHLATTYDGEKIRLFVDGVEAVEPTLIEGNVGKGAYYLMIGAQPAGYSNDQTDSLFQGYISDVGVWNYARSPEQIKETVSSGIDPKAPATLS